MTKQEMLNKLAEIDKLISEASYYIEEAREANEQLHDDLFNFKGEKNNEK